MRSLTPRIFPLYWTSARAIDRKRTALPMKGTEQPRKHEEDRGNGPARPTKPKVLHMVHNSRIVRNAFEATLMSLM